MSPRVGLGGLGLLGLGLASLVACGGSALDVGDEASAGAGGRGNGGGAARSGSGPSSAGREESGSGGEGAVGQAGRGGAAAAGGGPGNTEPNTGGLGEVGGSAGTAAGAGGVGEVAGSLDEAAGAGGVGEVAGSPDEAAGAGDLDVGDGTEAVAYQINPAHSGWQVNSSVRLPLSQRWQHSFEGSISYPVVADGRVFVTTRQAANYGTNLYALNAETGALSWGPVALGGTYFWSAAAYEAGRVFTINFDGRLSAFESTSGKQDWSVQLPGQYAFSSAPTASGGLVYVGGAGSGGTLYAVDETNGKVLWSASVENGDDSSPAVSPIGVFVSYACNQAYGFNPVNGLPLWHYSGQCEGGGGKTVMLDSGTVYTRDFEGNLVLDAAHGTKHGTYASQTIPVAANGTLYTMDGGVLSATGTGETVARWTFGGGALTTAPIVVGQSVVVGTGAGLLSVLSAKDGSLLGQAQLAMGLSGPDEQNVSSPLTGLSAAEGKLFVPNGTELTAY
jgi:outer membrane protein assembly factor BamB